MRQARVLPTESWPNMYANSLSLILCWPYQPKSATHRPTTFVCVITQTIRSHHYPYAANRSLAEFTCNHE